MIYFDPISDGFFDSQFNKKIPESAVLLNESQVKTFYEKKGIPDGKRRKPHKLELEDIPMPNYITEYDSVDSVRRVLYTQISDPLYMEAYRHKDNGNDAQYAIFKAQADAAVEKIRSDNPWPVAPEA